MSPEGGAEESHEKERAKFALWQKTVSRKCARGGRPPGPGPPGLCRGGNDGDGMVLETSQGFLHVRDQAPQNWGFLGFPHRRRLTSLDVANWRPGLRLCQQCPFFFFPLHSWMKDDQPVLHEMVREWVAKHFRPSLSGHPGGRARQEGERAQGHLRNAKPMPWADERFPLSQQAQNSRSWLPSQAQELFLAPLLGLTFLTQNAPPRRDLAIKTKHTICTVHH